MARTGEQYKQQLLGLLPKGSFWPKKSDSVLGELLHGKGDELSRVEERVDDLYDEKNLSTTLELLTEHEDDYGLPDEGDNISNITSKRREELQSMLLKIGQQFEQYYIDIASALGYTITIEEFTPAWCGVVDCDDDVGDQTSLYYWMVWIDIDSVTYSYEYNLTKLINKIKAAAPAHTHVLFDLYGKAFSRGFDRGFENVNHYDNDWSGLGFDPGFSDGFENNTDYYGVNYTGGFAQGFSIDYDRYSGGGFIDGFSLGFERPS